MLLLEVSFYQVRLALPVPQVASNVPDQFLFSARSVPAHGIAFDILIDPLVRVQFRTVARQRDQPDLASLLTHPVFDGMAAMNRMTIDDLFVRRNCGPLSSVFPVQVISISREDPFASHGLSKVPGPLEPLGQSLRGGRTVAIGAGALDAAETGVVGAGALGAGAGALSSLEQPMTATAATKATASFVMATLLASTPPRHHEKIGACGRF